MSSFQNLLNRIQILSEAKVSPYAKAHPAFGPITSKMRAGGLSAAPLDTIKFIRETLYYMDILNDEELNNLKRASGFTGKKQAMLAMLQAKQDLINQHKDEITARIEATLDDFINGVGINRGREEKYAAQAAAQEIAKEVRKAKSGKELDDALADVVSGEPLLIAASLAKVLGEIRTNLGSEGLDIDEEALSQVEEYAENIKTIAQLKSFIKQIQAEPGYEVIAAYLSSIVKPIESGLEDEEIEDEEGDVEAEYLPGVTDDDLAAAKGEWPVEDEEYDPKKADLDKDGVDEEWEKRIAKKKGFKVEEDGESKVEQVSVYTVEYGPEGEVVKVTSSQEGAHVDAAVVNKYLKRGFSLIRACAAATSYPNDANMGNEEAGMLGESKLPYTSQYLTEQAQKDQRNSAPKQEGISFKERMKPKTSWQLQELRRYGL